MSMYYYFNSKYAINYFKNYFKNIIEINIQFYEEIKKFNFEFFKINLIDVYVLLL